MQSHISIILIIALAVAFIAAAATCQGERREGELRAQEARKEAEMWEGRARAYAEALERAEEARRRAAQSEGVFLREAERAGERRDEARQILEDMGDDCWLDVHVPDGVRDIVRALFGAGCDGGTEAAAGGSGGV